PVSGDKDILRRVFVNIIENACKYSPADRPVEITARREASELRVAITDHGNGIPEAERERVFDMFYRIKSGALSNAVIGAGLGLSICRGFIEAHGGHISAQQGEGGGTSIVIRLPIDAE
ncbi:MAG: ATP-binding protein, partial [Alphaproteobacteria bacterium]|nr:ATP-binding protein [Alphaproteobacteria bacterium]